MDFSARSEWRMDIFVAAHLVLNWYDFGLIVVDVRVLQCFGSVFRQKVTG